MSLGDFSEAMIRQHATTKSLARGEEYYESDAVQSLIRRGEILQAEVGGSEDISYRVTLSFRSDGKIEALCSCPYEYEGWCKHIVAASLAALREPENVKQEPALSEVLAPLSHEQLLALLLKLAERDPDLAEDVVSQVKRLAPDGESGAASTRGVDPLPYRRQVRSLLRSLDDMSGSEAYYHVGGVVRGVDQTLDAARELLEAGDGRGALAIAEAVTEEYLKNWTWLDDSDGEAGALFNDIGAIFTEAILTADLTAQEREQWAQTLQSWQDEVDDYGLDGAFEAAIAAAQQGWEDSSLVRVLAGQSKSGVWKSNAPFYADELTQARLRVLERQKRFDEYLRLATAEKQNGLHAVMLAKLGRIAEAVKAGAKLRSAEDSLALAQTLERAGALEEALQIAERGLSLPPGDPEIDEFWNRAPSKATLALWLRDLAAAHGQTARAVAAARIVVLEEPRLSDYRKARELSENDWPSLRDELLAHLRATKSYDRSGAVDIFLHENLIDDALKLVHGSSDGELVGRVVDAAIQSRPQVVIPICCKQADAIMDGGKSAHYDEAAHWLRRAKSAYQVAEQKEEWTAHLEKLLETHKKKYKLRPLLEALHD